MISRTLAEKTLLDLGNFEVDRDYSDATRWQCFYVNCPEITIEVHWPNEAAGADSILLRIDLRELQSAVRGEFPTLSSREWEGFKLSALQELERVVSRVNELLQQHPEWCTRAASGEEFDPHDSESEMWETEEMRSVRLGQAIYRRALEQLWNGRCAVTGIGLRELLRASHAKPWAECETGAERLCPYNGFLLAVNLDALFDKFLISFEDDGKIIISPGLPQQDLEAAGITADMKLRFVQPKHLPFLRWHRARMAAVQRTLWRKR